MHLNLVDFEIHEEVAMMKINSQKCKKYKFSPKYGKMWKRFCDFILKHSARKDCQKSNAAHQSFYFTKRIEKNVTRNPYLNKKVSKYLNIKRKYK